MKRAIVMCFVVLSMLMSAWAEEPTGGLRYSITVSQFENQAGWHGQWDLGNAWGTVLTDMLNETGRFIVLGETDMRNEALAEQDLAASGRTATGNKAPTTGNLTPAQLLVKGAITHVQDTTSGGGGGVRIKGFKIGRKKAKAEINTTIYVVDSTTGQVLASSSVVGTSARKGGSVGYSSYDWGASFGGQQNDNVGLAVQDACAEAVDFITAQLPHVQWTGSVVLVKSDTVYINRGSREGVTAGQEFTIGNVEVLRDPDTGEVLDEVMTEVCRIRATQIKEKLSICEVTSGDAAVVQKGMTVHPL